MDWETFHAAIAYVRGLPWTDTKSWLDLILWYGILIAAFLCLARLRTILQVITAFNNGRGPLWDLRSSVNELKDLEPKLQCAIGQVSSLTDQMADLQDRVEALRVQLSALQVETISQRTGDVDPVDTPPEPATPRVAPTPGAPDDAAAGERNWEQLREYWRRNSRRLEFIIEQISDGRVKGAFDRLPRTNYVRIIHKLQGQGRISAAAAEASKSLITEFNRYRPRNRSIPDEVIEPLSVLDRQLDQELVPIAAIAAAEAAEDAAPAETSVSVIVTPARPLNGAGHAVNQRPAMS
jgi:hypothetical protein